MYCEIKHTWQFQSEFASCQSKAPQTGYFLCWGNDNAAVMEELRVDLIKTVFDMLSLESPALIYL